MRYIKIDVREKEFEQLKKAKKNLEKFLGKEISWKELFLYSTKRTKGGIK